MELSRERSPPAAAQELPGGERYLERGFPLFVFFSFFLYLAGKVFPFHLLPFLHVASVFLFVIAFVVIVILVVIEFAVGVLCSGKKQLISCSFSFSATNVVVCLKVPEARCSARRTRR